VTLLAVEGPVDDLCVDAEFLPRGGTGEQGEHDGKIIEIADKAFHAHQRYMDGGQGRYHAPIAFVCDETNAAGVCNAEVHTADADVCCEEDFAQNSACHVDKRGDIFGVRFAQFFVEKLTDFLAAQMDGGRDDMRRLFATQLDDVFAKVSLNDTHAIGFENAVEIEFL
jgi:hypothetical protein